MLMTAFVHGMAIRGWTKEDQGNIGYIILVGATGWLPPRSEANRIFA